MCPLQPLVRYAAMLVITLLLAGTALASAPRPSFAPRLLLNDTLVTSLNLIEGKSETLTFYLDDIPDDFVGELLIEISSLDGIEYFTISPNSFPVNDNVSTEDPSPNFPHDALPPTNDTSGDIPTHNRFTGVSKSAVQSSVTLVTPAGDAGYLRLKARGGGSGGRYLRGEFEASGLFLGFASFRFVLRHDNDEELIQFAPVPVRVRLGYHLLDKIFVQVVMLLMFILYIIMGCALDMTIIRQCLRRPVAPGIGLVCQCLFMPLCSYLLGYLLLFDTPALFLGLFVTGCSPGGAASNTWTLLLGGSLDVSVTMTFLSTVAAFGTMPLWMWVLAPSIFEDSPFDSQCYQNIALVTVGLVVPLAMGLSLQRCYPKAAAVLTRLLRSLSIIFLAFILTFGVYVYWYIFKFFTWKVALCGFLLPFLGFLFGGSVSGLCRRPLTEVIAISVETGLQNRGLALVLLKVALAPFSPMGDVATVVVIAIGTLTPVPLLAAYCVVLFRGCLYGPRTTDGGGKKEKSGDKQNGAKEEEMSLTQAIKPLPA